MQKTVAFNPHVVGTDVGQLVHRHPGAHAALTPDMLAYVADETLVLYDIPLGTPAAPPGNLRAFHWEHGRDWDWANGCWTERNVSG